MKMNETYEKLPPAKWQYTSHNGRIKIRESGGEKPVWEIEFDGKIEKGTYEDVLKIAVEAAANSRGIAREDKREWSPSRREGEA